MRVDIKQSFENIYGSTGDIISFFAPGRVNLIGEHIDYNGGYVLPCALDFGTYAVVRIREDSIINFATLNFDRKVVSTINELVYKKEDGWANYPKGVVKEFVDKGYVLKGFDILYYGEIPNGAGLSSSASLEILTGIVVNQLFDLNIDRVEIVKMSQRAENNFVGVNCGIMDQFIIGMGKKDNAILLDCETLEYIYVPLVLENIKIIIGNTKKQRGLSDSKYNERRQECDEAVKELRKKLSIDYLCELSAETFEENKYLINDIIVRRRAEHAVYENIRTIKAKKALEDGDIKKFGVLMNKSHDSLRDLYEVTGDELDIMVEEARKIPGTLGSRMTGAGFGGCTVSLVKEEVVDIFIKEVGDKYKQRTGLSAEFYIGNVGAGAYKVGEEDE